MHAVTNIITAVTNLTYESTVLAIVYPIISIIIITIILSTY